MDSMTAVVSGRKDEMANAKLSDVVSELLAKPFLSRPPREQHTIVKNGRSTPDLRFHPRHFGPDRYYIHPWLSGSTNLNSIVCWPCLLFKPNPANVWTNGYFNQMNTFTQAAQSHQCAFEHAEALIAFNQFEQNVRYHELQYIRHNEDVQKNRDILKKLTSICSLINQDFSFGRSDQSTNRTSNAELLQYITPLDDVLQEHLESSQIFYNMPYNIQENILSSINNVMDIAIKQELNRTKFVSVMVDELSDVSSQSQLSITLRYVSNGEVKERLLGIYNSKEKSAKGISTTVTNVLEEFKCIAKVVAHSYDGASVSSTELREIKSIMKKVIPGAILVHCYAHDLNQALRESVSFLSQCKVFFSVIQGISQFFANSAKISELLNAMIKVEKPESAPIQWKHQWAVNIIHTNRHSITGLLEKIVDNPNDWDTGSISSAKQLLNTVEDFEFNFLLTLFATVFEKMYTMYQTLKEGQFYLDYCSRVVNDGIEFLTTIYQKFEEIYEQVVDEVGPPTKRKVARQIKEYYKMFFIQIIDCLKLQLELRFSYITDHKLQFNSLLDPNQFQALSRKRLDPELKMLRDTYERMIDVSRLKIELVDLYKREDLANKTLLQVHNQLNPGEFSSGYPQVVKLAELILTIPTASVASDDQGITYLGRIKKYCSTVPREDRITPLAKMSIEKELLALTRTAPEFQENVIEDFIKKVPLEEFEFK